MKLTIIQTPNYILGVDFEAKILHDDWYTAYDNTICRRYASKTVEGDKKIIAHILLNGNKSLEGVWLLPEIENWEELYQKNGIVLQDERNKLLFRKGYKAAGGYTEEDIIKLVETRWYSEIINNVYDHSGERNVERLRHNIKADLKSLKPFPIEFEVEMEEYGYEPVIGKFPNYEVNPNPKLFRPKILNNIIQGKYIWKQLN